MEAKERKARELLQSFWILANQYEKYTDKDRVMAMRLNSPIVQEMNEYFEQHPWTEDDNTVRSEGHPLEPKQPQAPDRHDHLCHTVLSPGRACNCPISALQAKAPEEVARWTGRQLEALDSDERGMRREGCKHIINLQAQDDRRKAEVERLKEECPNCADESKKVSALVRLANEMDNLEGMRSDPMLREDPHAAYEARRYAENQIKEARVACRSLGLLEGE